MADVKEIMMEKGDKIALGGAVLLLVGYLAFAFGVQANDTEAQTITKQVESANNMLNSNTPPAIAPVDYGPLKASWSDGSVAVAKGSKSYVAMFKTTVNPKMKSGGGPVTPTVKDKFLTTPVISGPETELGQVKVKWADGKVPAGEEAAAISEYEVWRQEAGKAWGKLNSSKTKEYVDNTVEPKKKYAYKVKSRTKDKTKDGKQETDFSQVVEATVPSGVVIIYTGGSPQAAAITVRKFMGGEWKERKYTVLPKNEEANQSGAIGKLEKEKNPDTGKMVEVDYRTGFVLNEIKKDRFKFKRTVRKSKIVEGQLQTEDVEEDSERDRLKLLYTNDEGKDTELWISDENKEDSK